MPLSAFILLCPAVGSLLLCAVRRDRVDLVRRIAVASTALPLLAALLAACTYDTAAGGYQHALAIMWIPTIGIGLDLAMDGISVALVLLHALCASPAC